MPAGATSLSFPAVPDHPCSAPAYVDAMAANTVAATASGFQAHNISGYLCRQSYPTSLFPSFLLLPLELLVWCSRKPLMLSPMKGISIATNVLLKKQTD
ncbi:MAG: hypothetical protein P0107_02730 [Nitrosomonas sp.]|nr:hypothetical protein [Nitrosomonas sp.]